MTSEALSPELTAYYADRRLRTRNILLIILMNVGWSASFQLLNPLIQLRMRNAGVSDGALSVLTTVHQWTYSYLVMYFAWRSDHTRSRWGRRIPYLFISSPIIIAAVLAYSFVGNAAALLVLALVIMVFMDIKAATIPLLGIDCVPRSMLATVGAIGTTVYGLTNFLSVRYGTQLAEVNEHGPYLAAGLLLVVTTVTGGLLIREPPVAVPPRVGRFKPWSALAIAFADRKLIVLIFGVAGIMSFSILYNQWIWLFAQRTLGLSRSETGAALAWSILVPSAIAVFCGWLVDRFGGVWLIVLYWLIACANCVWLTAHTAGQNGLMVAGMIQALMVSLFPAADVMVYRKADARYVGSITSASACVKGVVGGCVVLLSGMLIHRNGGDYRVAFIAGVVVSGIGMGLIILHSTLGRRRPPAEPQLSAVLPAIEVPA